MKRPAVVLLTLSLLGLTACGGGGGSGDDGRTDDPLLQQMGECTGLGLEQLSTIVFAGVDLISAIENAGAPPAGVTHNPATGEFTIELDFDGDGTPESMITGTTTPAAPDLTGGGEFSATFSASGGFTGTGTLLFDTATFPGAIVVRGPATFTAPSGCAFDVDLDIQLVEDDGELLPNGIATFEATQNGNLIEGRIDFAPIEDEAIVNATFQGLAVRFFLDYDQFEPFFE